MRINATAGISFVVPLPSAFALSSVAAGWRRSYADRRGTGGAATASCHHLIRRSIVVARALRIDATGDIHSRRGFTLWMASRYFR